MDRQGGIKKVNKPLGTEICENIDTLYIIIKRIIKKLNLWLTAPKGATPVN